MRRGLQIIVALVILCVPLQAAAAMLGASAPPDPPVANVALASEGPHLSQDPYSSQLPQTVIGISTWRETESQDGTQGVWVGQGPGNIYPDCCNSYRALVQFNLEAIPQGVTVTTVEVQATVSASHGTGSETYNLARPTEPWAPETTNWNNRPSKVGPIAATDISATSGMVGWMSTDLDDIVRGWIDGTTPNYGLIIRRDGDLGNVEHDRFFTNIRLAIAYDTTTLPDLKISHMEVTQAVQDWDNGIPLVKKKRTVVRVSVSSCCQYGVISDIGVRLEGIRANGTSIGKIGPTQPSTNQMMVLGTPVDPLEIRFNSGSTFNFVLPSTWVNRTQLELVATVNASQRVAESDYTNNEIRQSFDLTYRPPLHMVGVIVYGTTEEGDYFGPISRDRLHEHAAHAERRYPVPDVVIWRVSGRERLRYDPAEERRASGVLADLAEWRTAMANATKPLNQDLSRIIWYGLDSWYTRGFGLSSGVLEATGHNETPLEGQLMAHEAGHCQPFSRNHASDQCDNWPYSDAGNFCDVNYPVAGGCLDEYGFDTVDMTVISPEGCYTGDTMSYSGYQWSSAYTYKALYDAAEDLVVPGEGSSASLNVDTPRGVLLFSGVVNAADQARLRPFYVVRTTAPVAVGEGTGEYSIVLEDNQGGELSRRRFNPRWPIGPPDAPPPIGYFGGRMLAHPGTARIVLYHGAVELAVRSVSDHAPQVTVLSPVGGETWTGPQTVSWEASDADQDDVAFMVMYSQDGGGSWQPISSGITETQQLIDFDALPGAEQAMLRVVATDGVRSNHGDSGIFGVPNKAPEVAIVEPDGTPRWRFSPSRYSISLDAVAYDIEDGPLKDASVVWASDKDGPLGEGDEIVVAELSGGLHVITVTATDSDQQTASDELRLYVLPEEAHRVMVPLLLRID